MAVEHAVYRLSPAEAAAATERSVLGLNIQEGAPFSLYTYMSDSLSWVYFFVEFFYGDC